MDEMVAFWVGAWVLALIFAFYRLRWVEAQSQGTTEMVTIAGHIREGAMAFLRREYSVLALFVALVAILLALGYQGEERLIAVSFVAGAFCSGLAGFIGMWAATASNSRTTHAARSSLNSALEVAFSGGSVMGLSVAGLGVMGLSLLFILYDQHIVSDDPDHLVQVMTIMAGFSLGASSIALFARVGGGIYTKAADVGADLVGKVEAGIPEDDPRNPATIADNVGDNVGDVAGMGADLFESFVGVIIGAMVLAAAHDSMPLVRLPLTLAAAGIFASIAGTFLVRTKEGGDPQTALNQGHFGAAALLLLASWFIINEVIGAGIAWDGVSGDLLTSWELFIAPVIGLLTGILIGLLA